MKIDPPTPSNRAAALRYLLLAQDGKGVTCLHHACRGQHLEIIFHLLSLSEEVLMEGGKEGRWELLKVRAESGWTALLECARLGLEKAMR